jgi:hypothetical protein
MQMPVRVELDDARLSQIRGWRVERKSGRSSKYHNR